MVASPIIITKINIPSIHHRLVQRPRLFQRLDRGFHSKLTLVCASAGSGKSTLTSSWLRQHKACTVWLSLDENDNDWTRFFLYMITALEKSKAGIGTSSLELLNAEKPLSYEELMANMISDLSQIGDDCILVLDDFHLIHSEQILTALTFLIDNMPPLIHLVLLARTEPPLPIARLRAQRQLTEITAGDMQFSLAESGEFLKDVMNLDLTKEEISKLTERTEGWIVGLQLAALSIGDGERSSTFVDHLTGKDRHIADYLIDEVLARQAEEVQSFLLKTAVLERMSGELCDCVLEIDNSQTLLETIERLNLFIIPLDSDRQWYRYHHLFGELLLSRLMRLFPGSFISLNQKACRWHKKNALLEESVKYAFKAEDYKEAATIIEQIGHAIYWANRTDTLRKWLAALPVEIAENSFELQILRAYDQINIGKVREAEQTLEKLKVYLETSGPTSGTERLLLEGKLESAFTSIRYHRHMDWSGTYRLSSSSLEALSVQHSYERCVAYFHGGGALVMSGELERAEQYLREARNLSDSVKNPFAKLLTLSNLGAMYLARGELCCARDIFRETYEFGVQCRASQEVTYSNALVGLANLNYEWNRFEEARKCLDEAARLIENYDFFDRILSTHEAIIQVQCGEMDFQGAENTLRRARGLVNAAGPTVSVSRRIEALQAYLDYRNNRFEKAVGWADGFDRSSGEKVRCEFELEYFILATLRMAGGDYGRAGSLLQEMLVLARRQNRLRSVIRIMVLLSVVYYRQNQIGKGLKNLLVALQLAQPEGFIRSFVDGGEATRAQLKKITDSKELIDGRQQLAEYIHLILGSFPEKPSEPIPMEPPSAGSGKTSVFSLTPRECDVLTLLDHGLTYAEIAARLKITENTLKYHIKNIYGKLQVNKRIKAVSVAKDHGYI